ncbi:MAG: phosphoglucosamine mutase [Thermodesulfobacteriota bacterium]
MASARRLFGTDGARGRANEEPMTPETALRLGRAVARQFRDRAGTSEIYIAKDTRASGDMLEAAVAAGICAAHATARLCGVLPTPGLAFLVAQRKAAAGVMISASHNPFHDNGIKVIGPGGEKLTDNEELSIEDLAGQSPETGGDVGRTLPVPDAEQAYADFLRRSLGPGASFAGLRVVLDCGNGAAFRVAPEVFESLGASVSLLGVSPDGTNINAGCGSQEPGPLMEKVKAEKAHLGLAFDGDADRCIAVDESGRRISGDQILLILARRLLRENKLAGNKMVATVMSNLGLSLALKEMGVQLVVADVGDRYVLEAMRETGAVLGGEDSGHVILRNLHTTGDGTLTGLALASAMLTEGRPLSRLASLMKVFPQVLINVPVASKPELATVGPVVRAIADAEAALAGKGRVLVRYSGTRSVCRVMVEGPTQETTEKIAQAIAATVRSSI